MEYGGSSPYPLGQHPYEKRLEKLAEEALLADIEAGDDASPIVSSTAADIRDVDDTTAVVATIDTGAPDDGLPITGNVRRRVGASPESPGPKTMMNDPNINFGTTEAVGVNSLAFISFFLAFWSGAQGAIEIAIPLWLSSPIRFGGLGYTPFMSGATMCVAALMLSSVLRTRASQLVSSMPRTNPLRAMRLALRTESMILFVMTAIPLFFE